MIKACIFDLDGTIANTLESIAGFSNEALKKCGYKTIELEKYKKIVGNGADTQMRRMLKNVKGDFTEDELKKLRAEYDSLYEAEPMKGVKEYDGVKEMLGKLKKQGIQLAVLSNKPNNVAQMVVEKLFSSTLFDVVAGQKDGIPTKPDPKGAEIILKELGRKPCECLYVGDTWVDMQTGHNAGMKTVGVLWGFRDRQELEENEADFIISSANELLTVTLEKNM